MYKTTKVEEAVGMVLAHDVTEIRRGEFKGRAFKKGHRIREVDICHFHRLGNHHIHVLRLEEGYLHENDAAIALADAFCGAGVIWYGEPKEGKLNLVAAENGLFKVNVEALAQINMGGEVVCASRHNNCVVEKGAIVAAARAIPLVVKSEAVDEAIKISRSCGGIFQVKFLRKAQVGIIITGSEVFSRLIEDQFEPILRKKIDNLGSETIDVAFAPDDADAIELEIKRLLSCGADLILTTGGMSVDPDDVSRLGIQKAGGKVVIYGTPVFPGAMLMIAYIDNVPVLGVPACGIYHDIILLDLVLPRILAGERLSRKDIALLGHGDCVSIVQSVDIRSVRLESEPQRRIHDFAHQSDSELLPRFIPCRMRQANQWRFASTSTRFALPH